MKRFLLVGGNSGIGLETAIRLKEAGNDLVAATRSQDQLKSLGIAVTPFDASQAHQIEIPDSLDGLVYFPGTISLKPLARFSREDILKDFEVNALAAAQVLQKALPALKKSHAASVVFFSTVAVQLGMPFHSSVAMAKGAVEGLARSSAAELAPKIRVNCIAPSLTDTPLSEALLSTDEKRKVAANRHPLKRIASAPEIASLVTFLLSEHSLPLTGQVLHPDNGLSSLKLF